MFCCNTFKTFLWIYMKIVFKKVSFTERYFFLDGITMFLFKYTCFMMIILRIYNFFLN